MSGPAGKTWRRVGWASALVVVAALAVGVWWLPFAPWSRDDIESWMATQLREVAHEGLQPELRFDDLEYDFPYTVRLQGAQLVADDDTVVIAADTLGLTLAELPREGEPLQIAEVDVDGATVRLYADGEGGLVGFSPFLREPPSDADVTASDIFRLHAVNLHDVDLEVKTSPDATAMVLDGLQLDLGLDRTTDADERVWYAFDLATRRGDSLSLQAEGELDLDRWLLTTTGTDFAVKVDPETIDSLPPGIRKLTDEHAARGSFRAHVEGTWNLQSSSHSALSVDLELDDFALQLSPYAVETKSLRAQAILQPGIVSLPELTATTMDGTVHARGLMAIGDDAAPWWACGSVKGFDLQRVLTKPDPTLGGTVRADGCAHGDALDPKSLRGRATVGLDHGHLLRLPLVSRLVDTLDRPIGRSQSGKAELRLHGERIEVTSLSIDTPVLGVQGEGHLTTAGHIDLRVAAGPLQKSDEGPVAEKLAAVGAQLWSYRVEGSLTDPRIEPRPLSIGNRG